MSVALKLKNDEVKKIVTRDPHEIERAAAALAFLGENYFRAEIHVEDLILANSSNPSPAIFASNHSGMSFPWDGIILNHMLIKKFGPDVPFTTMAAPALFHIRIMQLFGLPDVWGKFAVEANMVNFEALMQTPRSALVYPEGIAGIGKGFNKRYQLQKFSSSAIRMCLQYDRALVPIYTVNGEFINPYAYRFEKLDRLVQKVGIPFLPIGFSLALVLFFPFAFYMAWPAKLKFVVGQRIDIKSLFKKPYEQMSVEDARRITAQVQALMQEGLAKAVRDHENKRYDLKGFFKHVLTMGPRALLVTPLTWPYVFAKGFSKGNPTMREKIRAIMICVFMVTPILGWPLYLALIYGTKKD